MSFNSLVPYGLSPSLSINLDYSTFVLAESEVIFITFVSFLTIFR